MSGTEASSKVDGSCRFVARRALRWVAPLFSILAIACAGVAQAAGPPNVIVILADDIGIGDIQGFLSFANPNDSTSKIATPNLDRLISQGVRFARAYTSTPKCAPSRYALLTGNYHWRGLKKFGQWDYKGGSQILPGQPTIASELKKSGYVSAFFGKWHLGGNLYRKGSNQFATGTDTDDAVDFARPVMNAAIDNGFDYAYTLLRGFQQPPYAYFENDNLEIPASSLITWAKGSYLNGYSRINETGIGDPAFNSSETGPILASKAIDYLTRHVTNPVTSKKPFFLYYSANEVHLPNTPPDSLNGQPIRGSAFNLRADMVVEFDTVVGMFMDFLESHGLERDTLIVIASDNGASKDLNAFTKYGHRTNGSLRGGKGEIWEGGVRVPMIMRWGDGTVAGSTIPPGSQTDALFALKDLPATLLAAAGRLPADGRFRDGYSVLPEIMAPGQLAASRQSLLLEVNVNLRALVEPTWKLILGSNKTPQALYNLQQDPSETTDLLTDPGLQATITRLRDTLLATLFSTVSDSDYDGLDDSVDLCPFTYDPTNADDDQDGIGNVCDSCLTLDNKSTLDTDQDGLLDVEECAIGTAIDNPDSDGDGLTDYDEVRVYGLDPLLTDTDGDGISDADEVLVYHTNPLATNLAGDVGPRNAPDGHLGADDLLLLARFLLGETTPSALELKLTDLNLNDQLDAGDLVLLQRRIFNPQ